MVKVQVWDPLVRVFHWCLAVAFLLNAFITDPESDIHEYTGYFVMGLILFRILWGFIGTEFARFRSFPPSATQSMDQMRDIALGRKRAHTGHTPLGALMIYNLLGSLAIVTFSGFLMTTDMFWGTEWPEEVHEIAVTWVQLSVAMHIGAVIYESKRTGVNLPRSMVTGSKELPEKV